MEAVAKVCEASAECSNNNPTNSAVNEDSQVIAQQRINNEKRCIRCCSNFSVLFNKRRLCQKCKFHICKECSAWDADSQTWMCRFCSSREPSPSPEWLQKKLLERYRHFESAKKIKGNQRISDEYGRDENDSGYQQSDSVISWDSTVPKQKSLPDLLGGNPMLDPDILDIHEHVEAIVEKLIGDSIENTTLDPLYHNPEYDRMFEIYHGQLQESLLHLIQSLQLSINNQPIDENRTPTSAHSNLKYIVEKVTEEATALPFLHEPENASTPLPSLSATSNLEEEYDDQSYEDILATAILNKIIEKYQKGKQANKQFRNETYIYLNNNHQDKSTPRCGSICSYVSDKEIQTDFETDSEFVDLQKRTSGLKAAVRPKFIKKESSDQTDGEDEDFSWAMGVRDRSEPVQYTIEEKIEEITTTVENPNSGSNRSWRKPIHQAINEPLIVQTKLGRDASLPDLTYFGAGLDFATDRKVPFPEFGVALMDGSQDEAPEDEEEEDRQQSGADATLLEVMDTWENNWLFRHKKFVSPFRNMGSLVIGEEPISMLVPNPQEEVKARVGNRDIDELSEMSEKNSLDFTESNESKSLDDNQDEQERDIDEMTDDDADTNHLDEDEDELSRDIEETTTDDAESNHLDEDRSLSNSHYESLPHRQTVELEDNVSQDGASSPELTDERQESTATPSPESPHSSHDLDDDDDTGPEVIHLEQRDSEREENMDLPESMVRVEDFEEEEERQQNNQAPVRLTTPTPTPRRSKTPTLLVEEEVSNALLLDNIQEKPAEITEKVLEAKVDADHQDDTDGQLDITTEPPAIVAENIRTGSVPTAETVNERYQIEAHKSSSHVGQSDDDENVVPVGAANFIPGTIAAKEKQKWLQAVPISNNPYSKENIEKRTQRSSSFTIGALGGNRYSTLPIERLVSIEGNEEINPEESPLKRSESDKYRRDYYVSQDRTNETHFKRKTISSAASSNDENRNGKEKAKWEAGASTDASKHDRLDSKSPAESSRANTAYSRINALEAKVVRSNSNSNSQHQNELSQAEHKVKHLRHEKEAKQSGTSAGSADRTVTKFASNVATKDETATREVDVSPIALLGLPSVKSLASRFNGGQQQRAARANGKADDVTVRNGASNKPVPQPRTSKRLKKETRTNTNPNTTASTSSSSPSSDRTPSDGGVSPDRPAEVSSDCDVTNLPEDSLPRRPSVKQLSRRFAEDASGGDCNQSATLPVAAQVKRVHSLTARSLSREFREAVNVTSKMLQPSRANVAATSGTNGHVDTVSAASTPDTRAAAAHVGNGHGQQYDSDENDGSVVTSELRPKSRRNISSSIKSRAAFWDRRVAEELLADKLVREEFPPMESYITDQAVPSAAP